MPATTARRAIPDGDGVDERRRARRQGSHPRGAIRALPGGRHRERRRCTRGWPSPIPRRAKRRVLLTFMAADGVTTRRPVDVPARSRRTAQSGHRAGARRHVVLDRPRVGSRGRRSIGASRSIRPAGRPASRPPSTSRRRRGRFAERVRRRVRSSSSTWCRTPATPRRRSRSATCRPMAPRRSSARTPSPRTAARPSGSIAKSRRWPRPRSARDHEPRRRAHRRRAHHLHDRGRLGAAAERGHACRGHVARGVGRRRPAGQRALAHRGRRAGRRTPGSAGYRDCQPGRRPRT